MLRWPVKSALYIDFENVPLPPEAVANWLAWLEDGMFEPSRRRRRFVQKRVYWNSHAERHRETFERHGFSPMLVGKFSGLKNGADIRMAMDLLEATYTRSEIDEFILLTSDSDFVPVLERLREKSKRTVIVATEHRPNIHTTYSLHADLIIPSRRLVEAARYVRPRRGLLAKLRPVNAPVQATRSLEAKGRTKPAVGEKAAPKAPSSPRPPPQMTKPAAPPTSEAIAAWEPAIHQALQRTLGLLASQPQNYVAQRRVLGELDRVQGFKRRGEGAFLGFGSYRGLMSELARRDGRIRVVTQPGGGTGVVFNSRRPEASVQPAPPSSPRQRSVDDNGANGRSLHPGAQVEANPTERGEGKTAIPESGEPGASVGPPGPSGQSVGSSSGDEGSAAMERNGSEVKPDDEPAAAEENAETQKPAPRVSHLEAGQLS